MFPQQKEAARYCITSPWLQLQLQEKKILKLSKNVIIIIVASDQDTLSSNIGEKWLINNFLKLHVGKYRYLGQYTLIISLKTIITIN